MMNFKSAFEKATALCAQQERCASEIKAKLVKWEVEPSDIYAIIEQLIAEKYIDEERFAGFFVRDKYRFNRWGKEKIVWQLKQKGINSNIIADALETIVAEEYFENLLIALTTKNKQVKHPEPYKRRAALIRFGISRGYGYDEIKRAMEHLGV
jgi:regulatory protein